MSAPSGSRWVSGITPLGTSGAALGGPALEALDASAGVDQLLPPRVERVAVRADLDVDLGLRGARRELVAARAAHVGLDVLRMDFGLHGQVQCSGHPSALDCSRRGPMPICRGMVSAPLTEDHTHVRFRLRNVQAGAAISTVAASGFFLYELQTWDRPHRSAVAALYVLTIICSAILWRLDLEPVMRRPALRE